MPDSTAAARASQRGLALKVALHELSRGHDLESPETRGGQECLVTRDDESRSAGQRAGQELEVVGVVAGGRRHGDGLYDAGLSGDEIENGVDIDR